MRAVRVLPSQVARWLFAARTQGSLERVVSWCSAPAARAVATAVRFGSAQVPALPDEEVSSASRSEAERAGQVVRFGLSLAAALLIPEARSLCLRAKGLHRRVGPSFCVQPTPAFLVGVECWCSALGRRKLATVAFLHWEVAPPRVAEAGACCWRLEAGRVALAGQSKRWLAEAPSILVEPFLSRAAKARLSRVGPSPFVVQTLVRKARAACWCSAPAVRAAATAVLSGSGRVPRLPVEAA